MQATHKDTISPSVAASIGPTSLGNPDVALAVLSQFCETCNALIVKLGNKSLTSSQYTDQYLAAIKRAATVFDGEDPAYVPIPGWSGGPVRGQLRVMLPIEWMNPQRRAMFQDNTIAMYLDFLCAHLADGLKTSGGDEKRFADYMRPHLEQGVRIMTGALTRL